MIHNSVFLYPAFTLLSLKYLFLSKEYFVVLFKKKKRKASHFSSKTLIFTSLKIFWGKKYKCRNVLKYLETTSVWVYQISLGVFWVWLVMRNCHFQIKPIKSGCCTQWRRKLPTFQIRGSLGYSVHFLWRENNLLSKSRDFRKEITISKVFKLFLDSVLKTFWCHVWASEHKTKCCMNKQ